MPPYIVNYILGQQKMLTTIGGCIGKKLCFALKKCDFGEKSY